MNKKERLWGKALMKRIGSLLLILAMVLTTLPFTPKYEVKAAGTGTTLYLRPNENWKKDNARFALYYFNDSGNGWASMSDSDGDGIYEGVVQEGYSNVIFCRMNPSATDNNWNNKWNQTANLMIQADGKNCYIVADEAWDGEKGSWSTFTPNPDPGDPGAPEDETIISPVINADNSVRFYYKNTSATSVEVRADFNRWSGGDGYQMTKDDATGVWSCTVSELSWGIHQYKFFVNGNEWIADLCNSLKVGSDNNSAFTVSNPSAVDNNEIKVNIYYTRADGQYTVPNVDGDDTGVWNASVSVNNASGTRKDFEEYTEDGVKKARLTLTVNGRETRSLKIKTRLSTASREWMQQEEEQTVDLLDIVSGTVNVYLNSEGTNGNGGNVSPKV